MKLRFITVLKQSLSFDVVLLLKRKASSERGVKNIYYLKIIYWMMISTFTPMDYFLHSILFLFLISFEIYFFCHFITIACNYTLIFYFLIYYLKKKIAKYFKIGLVGYTIFTPNPSCVHLIATRSWATFEKYLTRMVYGPSIAFRCNEIVSREKGGKTCLPASLYTALQIRFLSFFKKRFFVSGWHLIE